MPTRCPTCTAPIDFAPGMRRTSCPFCRTEVVADGQLPTTSEPPRGMRVARALAARVETETIALVEAGAALPLAREIALRAAGHGRLRCALDAGSEPVAQLEVSGALDGASLTLRIDARGAAEATLAIPGGRANASFDIAVKR